VQLIIRRQKLRVIIGDITVLHHDGSKAIIADIIADMFLLGGRFAFLLGLRQGGGFLLRGTLLVT